MIAARSGCLVIVASKRSRSASFAVQATYSGGSNAAYRFMRGNLGERREALQWEAVRRCRGAAPENSVQHATGRAARLGCIGERRGELRRRLIAGGGLTLHALEHHLLDGHWKVEIGPRRANRRRLALE